MIKFNSTIIFVPLNFLHHKKTFFVLIFINIYTFGWKGKIKKHNYIVNNKNTNVV